MNACLGLAWLGMCHYDPAAPSPVYFTLGNAVAALAFTLAVHTFLKPVYRLRLSVRYLSLGRLYTLIFLAVFACMIAALVPNIGVLHGGPWGFSIVWEFVATIMFVVAYGAVAIAVVRPIKVRPGQVAQFTRGTARLLSAATEADHLDLWPDILLSLPILIEHAMFVEDQEPHTAFYDFLHRERIERGSYANNLLRFIADPLFCESLVRRAPWPVSSMLQNLGEKKLHCVAVERFVQELAHQSLLQNDGMLTREVGYHGFGTAPLLSDAFFSDPFVVEIYDPLEIYFRGDQVTTDVLERFNNAAKRCYLTLIENRIIGRAQVAYSIHRFYETAFIKSWGIQEATNTDYKYVTGIDEAVSHSILLANKLVATLSKEAYQEAFLRDYENDRRHDVLQTLVDNVFEAVNLFSNKFKGSSDAFWSTALRVMHDGFNSIGVSPDGMTPFQQRLAIKIIDKLQDNMKGYYPAICRVLLATVGPYEHKGMQPNATAYNLLHNAVWFELQRFPELAAMKPDKIAGYLPENVAFDAEASTLTTTYFGGAQSDLGRTITAS